MAQTKDQVRLNALTRYRGFLEMLHASELTLVHHTPGEDHCCEDVTESMKRKKVLARDMALVSIDAEIGNHSLPGLIFHHAKIKRLSKEKEVLKTLLD